MLLFCCCVWLNLCIRCSLCCMDECAIFGLLGPIVTLVLIILPLDPLLLHLLLVHVVVSGV